MPVANRLLFTRALPEGVSAPLARIDRLCAIDIGTNSVHAVIVDIFSDGSFRMVDSIKEQVGFGSQGLSRTLPPDAIDRAVAALHKIKMLFVRREAIHVVAYATSAVRESENGGEFIERVINETGIKILAIPGIKEAELIDLAVRRAIQIGPQPVLIMDIGGGSTEFILATRSETLYRESLKIGGSRMHAAFIQSDPLNKTDKIALKAHYSTQLERLTTVMNYHHPVQLIVTSGTMEAVSNMIARRRGTEAATVDNGFAFRADELLEFYREFQYFNHEQRLSVAGMDEKKADAVLPALLLTSMILKSQAIPSLVFCSYALREGMVIEHIQKLFEASLQPGEFPDVRHRSVYELLKRCQWHEKHSVQVARIALKLFDDLQEHHKLGTQQRELLKFACLLHDIGYHISQSKHHKHALYLIKNADLKGFTPDEIDIIAHVARYHRRSTPKDRHELYAPLRQEVKQIILKLSGFLRVADGLDRSHYQNVRFIKASLTEKHIEIRVSTASDPQLEFWGAKRKAELFETLFNRKLKLREAPEEEQVDRLELVA